MDTFDDGIVAICKLEDQAAKGDMPKPKLVPFKRFYYQNRLVSYSRMYAAAGVNERIDELIRIWQNREVRAGMYAVIGEDQFRINGVQHLANSDGLGVTDLTLVRLEEKFYDFNSTDESDP